MIRHYSKSRKGFSAGELDSVALTETRHAELMEGQSNGLEIYGDEEGHPQLREYIATNEEILLQAIERRDRLLRESDHTQLDDSPKDKVVWKQYRKDLRDITMQAGFPSDIVWPVEPE